MIFNLLAQIIAANLIATIVSMSLAAAAGVWLQRKVLQHLISLAAGTLLSMALLHLLPEAQEGLINQGLAPGDIFKYLLIGILCFFLLERLALFRHNHHNEHDGHNHHHGYDEDTAGHGGWMILVGSGIHNFTDGLLIAAAFLTDIQLGWATALAVGLHEVMHKLGDFVVLINTGFARRQALSYTAATGLMAVLGGVLGYFVLSDLQAWLPYVLVVSASSFLYIAVADLIPQISASKRMREGLTHIIMLLIGVALIWFTMQNHEHEHDHDHNKHEQEHEHHPT